MGDKHEVVIDLDLLAGDSEALGKLYEFGSLMVQSSNRNEVDSGYRVLEMVDQFMRTSNSEPDKLSVSDSDDQRPDE